MKIFDFGLGFIRIVLSETECLNVYLDDIPRFDNHKSPHNHQYPFKSTILKGKLIETLYYIWESENEDDAHTMWCACGDTDKVKDGSYSYDIYGIFIYGDGDTYERDINDYHAVEATHGTVTRFIKDLSSEKVDAYVIGDKSDDVYVSKYTSDELWDMVKPHIETIGIKVI